MRSVASGLAAALPDRPARTALGSTGNEGVLGLDLLTDLRRGAMALATIAARNLTLAGPYELAQVAGARGKWGWQGGPGRQRTCKHARGPRATARSGGAGRRRGFRVQECREGRVGTGAGSGTWAGGVVPVMLKPFPSQKSRG